jgi:Protein of unknown function (DUF1569)
MKSIWDDRWRRDLDTRIDRIDASLKPRWGTMSADRMLSHLRESLRMALGELQVRPKKLPIRYFPLKQLVVYLLPFPKGLPTAPELISGSETDCIRCRVELHDLLRRLAGRAGNGVWPDHPAFGKMSKRGWGVLTYRHLDHHLRQFGV